MKRAGDNRRMKRALAIVMIGLLVASPKSVFAIDQVQLTNDQIEYIRNNCGDTQTAIGGIRATDRVAYINLTQQLDTLSNRLMAPMNSRVALNKLDGVALTKITVGFNTEIKQFKELYREYEQSIDATTAMGCYNQPVEFYDNLTSLLKKRAAVRGSLDKLTAMTALYRSEVETVQKQALLGSVQQ